MYMYVRTYVCEMATPKQNDLPLKIKYKVITTDEREPKLGVRELAKCFQCGKTQVSTILKNKVAVRKLYESNASNSLCQARKRNQTSEYADLNDCTSGIKFVSRRIFIQMVAC